MSPAVSVDKKPSQLFSKNLVFLKNIQLIQDDLTRFGAKKLNEKIRFLNQSYIFQMIAFWQVFIENLVEYGFELVSSSKGASIPKEKLDELLKKFNTPDRKKIDRLFQESLGIEKISKHWKSDSLTFDTACQTVAQLLKSRHQIAHQGLAIDTLAYDSNFEKMEILMQIANLTEEALLSVLASMPNSAV